MTAMGNASKRLRFFWRATRRYHCAAFLLTCQVAIAALGFWIVANDGLPSRFSKSTLVMADSANDRGAFISCPQGWPSNDPKDLCLLGDRSQPPSFVLWGDSFAGSISDAADISARDHHRSGYLLRVMTCPPIIGGTSWQAKYEAACATSNNRILELMKKTNISNVILHANWKLAGAFENPLHQTLVTLSKANASSLVIMSMPHANSLTVSALTRMIIRGKKPDIRQSRAAMDKEFAAANNAITSAIRGTRSIKLDPFDTLCDAKACPLAVNGSALFHDGTHLSGAGARANHRMLDGWMAESSLEIQAIR